MRTDSDERFSNVTQDVRKGLRDAVKGEYKEPTGSGQVTIDPKKGEAAKSRQIVKKFLDKQKKTPSVDQPFKPLETKFVNPRRIPDPFQDDEGMGAPQGQTFKPQKDEKTQRKEAQARIDNIKKSIRSGVTKSGEQAIDVITEPARKRGRRARTYKASTPEKRAERLAKVKADIDKRNPTFTSPVTGGQLPVGGVDYQKKQQKAFDSGLEAAARGTQTGNIPVDPYKVLPSGRKRQEGTPQKDRPSDQQQQQQQQQNTYKNFNKELEKIRDPYERIRQFYANQGKPVPDRFKNRQIGGGSGGSGGGRGGSGGGSGGGTGGSGGGSSDIVRTNQIQKKGSVLSRSFAAYNKFAKANPALGGVAGLAGYDIGKGILGKIKKGIVQSLNVQKSTRTGRVSAGT